MKVDCRFLTHQYPIAAPECCKVLNDPKLPLPRSPPHTTEADIWALGCLLSEILIWTRLGGNGVAEYSQRRHAEISTTLLSDTAWDRGFHDGSKRLSCVDEMHKKALKGCLKGDFLHHVSQLILKMLQPKDDRGKFSAEEIRSRWMRELTRFGQRTNPVSPAMAVGSGRTSGRTKSKVNPELIFSFSKQPGLTKSAPSYTGFDDSQSTLPHLTPTSPFLRTPSPKHADIYSQLLFLDNDLAGQRDGGCSRVQTSCPSFLYRRDLTWHPLCNLDRIKKKCEISLCS